MTFMKRLRRVVSFSKVIACITLLVSFPALPAQESRWDPEGAARAFQDAEQMRSEISQATLPNLSQYLECAKTYRKVHTRDPHYSRVGDAIYQEGLVYQEMGDKFSNLDFYRTAVKRYQLLVRDYGGNRNCPDALLRTGDILRSLNDETAAQDAYRRLKDNYKGSPASRQLKTRMAATTKPPAAAPPSTAGETSPVAKLPTAVPPLEEKPPVASTSFVQSVRHWSTGEYTRVIIDLDANARYSEKLLSNPERIYFDISEAKLSGDIGAKILTVNDEFLKQIRISQNSQETVRVVLDLSSKGDHSVSEMHDPFRIVIDLLRPGMKNATLRISPAETKKPAELARSEAVSAQISTERKEVAADTALHAPKSRPSPAAGAKASESRPKEPPRAITDIQSIPLEASKPTPPAPVAATAAKSPLPVEVTKDIKPDAHQSRPKDSPPSSAAQISGSQITTAPSVGENRSDPVKTEKIKVPDSLPAVSESTVAKTNKESTPPSTSASRPASPTSFGDRTLTRMLGLKIGRIVIDPGHGGHDQGTIGPGGLLEKDLVLSIAYDLQNLLQDKLGAQVLLTRTDDTFISLEERTAIANRFHADLFISIHANSSRSRSTSGVETYYLNFAKTDAEREIASRENATSASNISELEDLVKKIAQADKSAESKELASIMQQRLYSGVKKMFPTAQNRGVRSAPFIVLIGANMPSILTEVAFISNPRDERLLKKSTNQERLVKALFSGIEGYMKTLGSDVAQNQPNTAR